MNYSSHPSDGPGGNGYSYDDYGIPAYHEQGSNRHQKPARPRPRPSQQQPYQQHPYQQQYYPPPQRNHQSDPRMRFPRPQAYPKAQPMEQNMYDGSGYGEPEQDEWPLASQQMSPPRHQSPQSPPQAQRQKPTGARSGPPPRPRRPDYVPPGLGSRSASAEPPFQQLPSQQRQQPRSVSADQPSNYHQPIPQQSHHGTGQWTGDGYGYGGPPLPSNGYPVAQHATYNKNGPPRPPLGPPPSARRGPSSYYSQQLADVHPIVEEAERASFTKEMMENEAAWGSQSGVSMTSIPIGIPKFYLDGRESGVSIGASSTYSDYAPDISPPTREEPLRPFQQRVQQQDADDGQENMTIQQQKAAERQEARGLSDYFPPPPDVPAGSSERGESPSEAPVRQASLGRRRRPTLTTVKSGDRMRSSSTASQDASATLPSLHKRAEEVDARQSEGDARSGADREAVPVEQSLTAPPPPPVQSAAILNSNANPLEPSSETTNNARPTALQDSPKSRPRVVNSKESLSAPKPGHKLRGRSPLAKTENNDDHDPLDKEILVEDPEKDGKFGLLRQDSDTLMSPTTGLSGARAGKRKPPRLDVDKIKEEEKRGSLSSLSDLIKRATKVASNLDRGRTASRLGMEAWLGPGNGNGNGKGLGNSNSSGEAEKYRRSAGSLSDILASFPPPVVSTPTNGRENRSLANWSSRRSSAPLPSDSDGASQTRSRKQRRCCGIPLWLFITLLLLLIALVAAAAVIPVFLIVIPNQKDKSAPAAQSDLAASNKCAAKVTCENGGQAFPTGEDTCRCLCVNSFTGPTCSSRSTAGCSSIAVSGLSENATIGDAIPRLITLSETDYDLKLDAQTLLGLFNEADLNCASENALVSFDGKTQKHRRMPAPQASQTNPDSAEATRNGIVFDSSPSPSQTSASTAPSSTTSSSSSASPTASKTIDVDFARAAVLYILQSSSSLQDAESAQKALQENLSDKLGGIVDVGQWNVDLDAKVVTKA
ncbi:hypothetical protein Q7P35_008806 [Cladosporium inversicolor]